MLVLSRKPGEKILIGDKVQITIVRIGPNTVRLGIDAPRDMNIVRDELVTGDGSSHGDPEQLLLAQHEGPLDEIDQGPASPPLLAVTEMKTAE